MLLADIYKIPTVIALGLIAVILLTSIVASVLRPRKVEITPGSGRDGSIHRRNGEDGIEKLE
jgi:hypothetical protein